MNVFLGCCCLINAVNLSVPDINQKHMFRSYFLSFSIFCPPSCNPLQSVPISTQIVCSPSVTCPSSILLCRGCWMCINKILFSEWFTCSKFPELERNFNFRMLLFIFVDILMEKFFEIFAVTTPHNGMKCHIL